MPLARSTSTSAAGLNSHRALRIFRALKRLYPQARCQLNYGSIFQLLCATILSAQCSDRAVNAVTPALFRRFFDAFHLARASQAEVERLIRCLGLFRSKARNLIECARALVRYHCGQVPRDMEALRALPGVGRKTANVVRFNGFGLPGLAVDTHVLRVGRRLGLFRSKDPEKVERILCRWLPAQLWGMASHWLIWHGRRICSARKPACAQCGLAKFCPSFGKFEYNEKIKGPTVIRRPT